MPDLVDPALDPNRAEKLIKGAKSDPIAFAFGLGQTPDKSVMAVDKSKAGKALFELCRKEGGAKKGAYGTVRVVGSTAVFACEKEDISNFEKAVLAYFKANKIGLKAEVMVDAAADAEHEKLTETKDMPGKERKRESAEESQESEEEKEEEDVPEGKIFDPDVIYPLIRKAKKKARPFAFGTGPGIGILAVHPKMDPGRLAKKVRAEGAKKGVWGTVLLDGSVAVFTCEKEPFAGVKKGIKRWLKDQKLNLKFRVQGPEGEYDDPEDVEEEEETEREIETRADEAPVVGAPAPRADVPSEESEASESESDEPSRDAPAPRQDAPAPRQDAPAPRQDGSPEEGEASESESDEASDAMAEIRTKGAALMPALRDAAKTAPDRADAIKTALQIFKDAVAGPDTGAAERALAALERLAAAPAPTSEAPDLATPLKELRARAAAMARRFPARAADLRGFADAAQKAADLGDAGRLDRIRDTLAQLVDSLEDEQKAAEAQRQRFDAQLTRAQPDLDRLARAHPEMAGEIKAIVEEAKGLLASDPDAALDALAGLNPFLLLAANLDDPAEVRSMLLDNFNGMWPDLRKVMETRADIRGEVEETRAAFFAAMRSNDFIGAQKLLDVAEGYMKLKPTPGEELGEAGQLLDINFKKALIAWNGLRRQTHADIAAFKKAILEAAAGDAGDEELVTEIDSLDSIMADLDDGLSDTVDAAISASDVEKKRALKARALHQVQGYRSFVEGDHYLGMIDDNPFISLSTKKNLLSTLGALEKALA